LLVGVPWATAQFAIFSGSRFLCFAGDSAACPADACKPTSGQRDSLRHVLGIVNLVEGSQYELSVFPDSGVKCIVSYRAVLHIHGFVRIDCHELFFREPLKQFPEDQKHN
jgi:hypothetical protein